jgi:hypothetical protein
VHLFSFRDSDFSNGEHVGTIGKGYSGSANYDLSNNIAEFENEDGFGYSVSLNQNLLAVSAPFDSGYANSLLNSGSVNLYNFSDEYLSNPSLQAVIGKGYSGGKNYDLGILDSSDGLGFSVSLDNRRLAIGAYADDGFNNNYTNTGAVYLFSFADSYYSSLVHESTIGKGYIGGKNYDVETLSDTDLFGSSVSLNGKRLAIGAYQSGASNTGSVYLFSFADSSFNSPVLESTIGMGHTGGKNLNLDILESADNFGHSVALYENRLAVGARFDDGFMNVANNSGSVYIFGFDDLSFSNPQKLSILGKDYVGVGDYDVSSLDGGGTYGDSFGWSLSLFDKTLYVGAFRDDGFNNQYIDTGSVYIFDLSNEISQKIIIGKGYSGGTGLNINTLDGEDWFGAAVSASTTSFVVGASKDDGSNNQQSNSGAVYLFGYSDGSNQSQTEKIIPSSLTNILNTSTNLTLQASNDITLNSSLSVNNPNGNGGDLTIQAGRSILLNANITTDNGNLNIFANDTLANGVVDAERDSGDAVITMASGISIAAGTGTVNIEMRDGSGKTNRSSNNITLGSINASQLNILNKGSGQLLQNQTSSIDISGTTNLQTESDIVLLSSSNDFNDISVQSNGSVTVRDMNALNLNMAKFNGTMQVISSSDLNINSSIVIDLNGTFYARATDNILISNKIDVKNGGTLKLEGFSDSNVTGNIDLKMNSDNSDFIGKINLEDGGIFSKEGHVYSILRTASDFENLQLEGNYILGNDIDYTTRRNQRIDSFNGNLEGGGYFLSNVIFDDGYGDSVTYGAIFGQTFDAEITNIKTSSNITRTIGPNAGIVGTASGDFKLRNVISTGSISKGAGLVAYLGSGEISNAYVKLDLDDALGAGIASYNNSLIDNSHFDGNINGRSTVGGIVGNNRGYIKNSSSSGNYTSTGYGIGGLVGFNEDSGIIENSYSSANINGVSYIGGLVGQNGTILSETDKHLAVKNTNNPYTFSNASIISSYSTGNVNQNPDGSGSAYIGGLVGWNRGKITKSYSRGSVNALDSFAGGLIGWNEGEVKQSFSTGNVSGSSGVAGLAGVNQLGALYDIYARGSVTANTYAGGLVAWNISGIVKNGYSTGTVVSDSNAGGLIGVNGSIYVNALSNDVQSSVIESFWDVETSGLSSSAAGVGKTTSEMKTTSMYTDALWDFTNVWKRDEQNIKNDGYPYFSWQTYIYQTPITLDFSLNSITSGYTYNGSAYNLNQIWDSSSIFGNNYSSLSLGTDYNFLYNNQSITSFTNAGSYTDISISFLNTAYNLGSNNTLGSLTITPKQLTISGSVVNNKDYDGTDSSSLNVGSLSGLVNNETLDVTAISTFDDKNAGTNKNVSVSYQLRDGLNGGLASNYILNGETLIAVISPKLLNIDGSIVEDRIYNGSIDANVTEGTLSGLIANEELFVTAAGLFDNPEIGFDKNVDVTYQLSDGLNGGLASNYRLNGEVFLASILPVPSPPTPPANEPAPVLPPPLVVEPVPPSTPQLGDNTTDVIRDILNDPALDFVDIIDQTNTNVPLPTSVDPIQPTTPPVVVEPTIPDSSPPVNVPDATPDNPVEVPLDETPVGGDKNRGHGNDADGFDEDNPGQGNFDGLPSTGIERTSGRVENSNESVADNSRALISNIEALLERSKKLKERIAASESENLPSESTTNESSISSEDQSSVISDTPVKVKDDNGHGNDADGVDESNPSKGKGGPNAEKSESAESDGASDEEESTKKNEGGDKDRGHGNDDDGVDEDNPGKSSGTSPNKKK